MSARLISLLSCPRKIISFDLSQLGVEAFSNAANKGEFEESIEPLAEGDEAHVVFSGDKLVMVDHPTRGRLTIMVGKTGLVSGDRLRVGDFGLDKSGREAPHTVEFASPSGRRTLRARAKVGTTILPHEWILLLQIDSDDDVGMHWGDAGRIYYWIPKQFLAQQDFEKVWLFLQCC